MEKTRIGILIYKVITTSICGLIILLQPALSQDIHFSQFNSNPLLMNPALTGHIDGTYRLHLHFRNQWLNLAENGIYNTPSASFDANFGMRNSYSSIGVGAVVAKDYSGSGAFEQLIGLLSLSYHLSLDSNERYFLSLGVQAGFYQKRLDFSKLTFESQFNGVVIDPGINSMESLLNDEILSPNFRVGFTWSSYFEERFKVIVGGAYVNVLEPDENFIGRNQLPSRLVIHVDLEIGLSSKLSLGVQTLYMKQAEAQQTNAGLSLKYGLPRDFSFSLGGYYRIQDALIGVARLGFRGIELGFSYDYTTSELGVINDGVGAFEVSITYTGRVKKSAVPEMPAIRFF